ncbi:Rhodanese-like domain-containing protein [Globomyces pollinis-pini]|nr:Rhodanese-like domain-containing protein [Globomyces pollinis-pini]
MNNTRFFQRAMSTIVSKSYVKSMVENPGSKILIDVREPGEYAEGFIPSSKNLSVQKLQVALTKENDEFKELYGFEKPSKDDHIVFYCKSGMRSAVASKIAESHGFKNIYDYSGSWLDWSKK